MAALQQMLAAAALSLADALLDRWDNKPSGFLPTPSRDRAHAAHMYSLQSCLYW
jgi:hypothetical protein